MGTKRAQIWFGAAFILAGGVAWWSLHGERAHRQPDVPPSELSSASVAQTDQAPEATAATPARADEPLRGFVPKSASELDAGRIVSLASGAQARLWRARKMNAPLILLLPDAKTTVGQWRTWRRRVGEVMDVSTLAWDGQTDGRQADHREVSAALRWARSELPAARAVIAVAVGLGVDAVVTAAADEDALIVVAVRGRLAETSLQERWRRPSLPWSLLEVGPIVDINGVAPSTAPATMMHRELKAPVDSPIEALCHDAVRPKVLAWMFAIAGG